MGKKKLPPEKKLQVVPFRLSEEDLRLIVDRACRADYAHFVIASASSICGFPQASVPVRCPWYHGYARIMPMRRGATLTW